MGNGGKRLRLSCNRTLVLDLLHYDQKVPTCVHDRWCDLSLPAQLRASAPRRISWPVLFLKAYGLTAAEYPQLRQSFLAWPWPHLYQHPHSVGTLVISRRFLNEDRLCWARIDRPENLSLCDLQQRLDRFQNEPVEKIFRRQVRMSRLPTPLRRLGWWLSLNVAGGKRATRLGTFGLSTLAGHGTEIQRPPSMLTTTLTYGPLDRENRARVSIGYDHRVMDGLVIAHCLSRLETILQGPICRELEELATARRTSADVAHTAAA